MGESVAFVSGTAAVSLGSSWSMAARFWTSSMPATSTSLRIASNAGATTRLTRLRVCEQVHPCRGALCRLTLAQTSVMGSGTSRVLERMA